MDIFEFWSQLGLLDRIHPADKAVFARVNHGFDLTALPGCFSGPLKTAPVVLLYLSPGLSPEDAKIARSASGRARRERTRRGTEPLPTKEDHEPAWRWWTSRTKCFGSWQVLRSKLAILNIGAYHSKSFVDAPLLAALPSSRMTLDWAQNKLFPAAEAGERVVVCMRSANFWGLTIGKRYGRSLFAPNVTRGGHMHQDKMRDAAIAAVRKAIG